MRFPRSAGLLCHITSLPGPDGIGDLGTPSMAFVDFLAAAGQNLWQMLPLSPPAEGNSPYSAYSAFAGNPLMISLQELAKEGLLSDEQASSGQPEQNAAADPAMVDFAAVAERKQALLRLAFEQSKTRQPATWQAARSDFENRHADWLDDFACYEVLLNHFGEPDWTQWPAEWAGRAPEAMAELDGQFGEELAFSKFKQFVFDRQWQTLKRYANERKVRLYGDMPIFVAHESADVWANRDLFALRPDGTPALVAGVPPDYFSKTGQLWGNPQYDWQALELTDFDWWTRRFARAFEQFDLLRVDHFRGFEAYWEVPADARTAIGGRWVEGPGAKPFRAAEKVLGELPLVAEDLGLITEGVHQLRDELGFPGMRVLQFGFDSPNDDFHRPSAYPEHSVAYTGTHDNDTVMGWYGERLKGPAKQVLPSDDLLHQVLSGDEPVHWQLVGSVWRSPADTVVAPVQDILGLGNEARMNRPGQAKGNWAWRMTPGALTAETAERLRRLTEQAGR